MAQSAFDPAFSTLDNYQFAGGKVNVNPGGPPVKKDSPYAAMAGEMAAEMAYNAGAEYMAPEGEWNEELGKMVYTKKPFGSIFGDYIIPEDAIWGDQLQAMLKSKEIESLKLAEQKKSDFITKSAFDNERKMEMAAYGMPRSQFEKSIVSPVETVDSEESKKFIEPNSSDVSQVLGAIQQTTDVTSRLRVAAKPYKTSFSDAFTPNMLMNQDDKIAHIEQEDFYTWAVTMQYEGGAGDHFKINTNTPNYEALKLYEANPLQYWRDNIKGKE